MAGQERDGVLQVSDIGIEHPGIELVGPCRSGRPWCADGGIVDRIGSRFEPLPDDPEAHDVESEICHALRLALRQYVATGALYVHLVGRDLVDEVNSVEQDGASFLIHQLLATR